MAVTALQIRRLGILLAPLLDILVFCTLVAAGLSLRDANAYAFAIGYALNLLLRWPALRKAEKYLDVPLPGQATTALVLGDNQRKGFEADAGGRSDTILLMRADPKTNTISLLSLPRADANSPADAELAALGVTDMRVALRLRPYEPVAEIQLRQLTDDACRFASWVGRG